MALPTTRNELKTFCLRKLGAPVIQINVSNDQLEDRLDEAVEMFQQYHTDGTNKVFLPHKITASVLSLQEPAAAYKKNDPIVGATSGAVAIFLDSNGSTLRFMYDMGSPQFLPNETINGPLGQINHIVNNPNFQVLGDMDLQYIPIPDGILSIYNILDLNQSTTSIFDVRYQFYLNNMPNFASMDIISFAQFNWHISLLNFLFEGVKPLRFNKKDNKLFIDTDWRTEMIPDSYVVVECLRALDPNQYPKVWSDYWVREYTLALFMEQWGHNLDKYQNIQLPGGVTLNGSKILEEALAKKDELLKQLRSEFMEPPEMITG